MTDTTGAAGLHDWLRARTQARLGRDYIYDKFDARKTALVVVDMQNYFMEPEFLAGCPMALDAVPAVNAMATALRAQGGTVVWVQTTAAPEATRDWGVYREMFSPENWARRNTELAEDHAGFRLHDGMATADGDVFVTKTRFSALIPGASDLDGVLKAHGIDTVLIAGVATGVCCEATARDAMMMNYRVVMVADALAAMSVDTHENALKALHGLFADVQTVAEVRARLG